MWQIKFSPATGGLQCISSAFAFGVDKVDQEADRTHRRCLKAPQAPQDLGLSAKLPLFRTVGIVAVFQRYPRGPAELWSPTRATVTSTSENLHDSDRDFRLLKYCWDNICRLGAPSPAEQPFTRLWLHQAAKPHSQAPSHASRHTAKPLHTLQTDSQAPSHASRHTVKPLHMPPDTQPSPFTPSRQTIDIFAL